MYEFYKSPLKACHYEPVNLGVHSDYISFIIQHCLSSATTLSSGNAGATSDLSSVRSGLHLHSYLSKTQIYVYYPLLNEKCSFISHSLVKSKLLIQRLKVLENLAPANLDITSFGITSTPLQNLIQTKTLP